MIEHSEIADRAGVTLDDLDQLLTGQATNNVAQQLQVNMDDVAEFMAGSTTPAMKQRLGLNTLGAGDELARAAGREGAIGILIGLLLSK